MCYCCPKTKESYMHMLRIVATFVIIHVVSCKWCMYFRCTYMWPALRKPASHIQQQDTLFMIKRWLYTLSNNSARYWCSKFPWLLLLWLVSEACQMPMNAQRFFKWLYLPLTSRLPAGIHHTPGWWIWPWI